MRRLLAAALLAAVAQAGWAVPASDDAQAAFAWLQKMAQATHRLNYSGVFVYQREDRVETVRIVHRVDESGEHAKLVYLDGQPRETYRIDGDVLCFLPDGKTALLDKSRARTLFPALLPEHSSELKASYAARLAGRGRVAGRETQVVVLAPRDAYRYGHKFWADTETGLPLRAGVWQKEGEMVDRFSFTQVNIGGPIARSEVRPQLAGRRIIQHDPAQSPDGAIDSGWKVGSVPPGFKRISAMKRTLPGQEALVNHIVYSDGLAAVSIFIQPAQPGTERGLSQRGALHVYTRLVADHDVKVLGEVPAATVRLIGDSISYEP
ncbi:MucB/RseB C-terminal domain-containing protein [Thiobacter aerophilum]|uniref:MucB/RseB C-terminal domain-containing protein n=1 Tax=Thiobacter aerophilum TaxID=3121275 RepID=A0ABV0EAI6_9BURK